MTVRLKFPKILPFALGVLCWLSSQPCLHAQAVEGIGPDGFFQSYLVLGPYNNPAGWDITAESQALDFLCDGTTSEASIVPADGLIINKPNRPVCAAPNSVYRGPANPTVRVASAIGDLLNLREVFNALPTDNVMAYAWVYVENTTSDVLVRTLALGSDDGVEVKVNGQQVINHAGPRSAGVAGTIHDRAPVHLLPGGNLLQFKVFNGCCDWGVRARLEGGADCTAAGEQGGELKASTLPLTVLSTRGPGVRSIQVSGQTAADITVTVDGLGTPFSLRESIPPGWTVASLSAGGRVEGSTLAWDDVAAPSVSYRLERSAVYGARDSGLTGILTLAGGHSLVGGERQIPGFALDFVSELLLLPPLDLGGISACGAPVEFLDGPWLGDGAGITDQSIVPRAGLAFRPEFGGAGSQAVGLAPVDNAAEFWTDPTNPAQSKARVVRVGAGEYGEFPFGSLFPSGWGQSVTIGFVYLVNDTTEAPRIVHAGLGSHNPVTLRLNGRPLWPSRGCPNYEPFGAKYAFPVDPGKNLLAIYSFSNGVLSFRFEDAAGAPQPVRLTLDPDGYDPDPALHPVHQLPPLPLGAYSRAGFVTQFLVPAKPLEQRWQGNTQPNAVPEDYITVDGAPPSVSSVRPGAAVGAGSTGRITTAVRGAPDGKTTLVLFDGVTGPSAQPDDPGLFNGVRFYSNPRPNYSASLFCFLDNRTPSDQEILLGFASDDAATLFLNGERIGQEIGARSYGGANTIQNGPLAAIARPGLNLVQLSYNDGGGDSGARLQVLSACTGKPLSPWQVAVFAAPPPRAPIVLELEPAGRRSVALVLDSTVAVRGGEVGLAYDPTVFTRLRVAPGSDLPPGASVFYRDEAPIGCAPELGVAAGITLSWLSSATSEALLPAGRHEIARISYGAAEGAGPEACTRLRFVACLGDAAAPVHNIVTTEDLTSVTAETRDGEACLAPELDFQRGDANGDGRFDITDPIVILSCLFLGTSCHLCPDASDADDTGQIDISDPIHLLRWRFGTGSPPPPPFPACGLDASDDDLPACEASPPCE